MIAEVDRPCPDWCSMGKLRGEAEHAVHRGDIAKIQNLSIERVAMNGQPPMTEISIYAVDEWGAVLTSDDPRQLVKVLSGEL